MHVHRIYLLTCSSDPPLSPRRAMPRSFKELSKACVYTGSLPYARIYSYPLAPATILLCYPGISLTPSETRVFGWVSEFVPSQALLLPA